MSLLIIFSLQIVQVAMSDSLFKKYPHLHTLVSEDDQHVSDQSFLRGESSRRSLLGPGVGPRKELQTLAPVRSESKPPTTAVDLFARSVKADKDDWLDFTIQESLSARQQSEQLKIWLVSNKPSQVTRQSGVGWISVRLGSVVKRVEPPYYDPLFRSHNRRVKSAEAKAEWDDVEGERNMETVNTLANNFGDTGGKWLFHVTRESVDSSFSKLAQTMLCGGLGPSVNM